MSKNLTFGEIGEIWSLEKDKVLMVAHSENDMEYRDLVFKTRVLERLAGIEKELSDIAISQRVIAHAARS